MFFVGCMTYLKNFLLLTGYRLSTQISLPMKYQRRKILSIVSILILIGAADANAQNSNRDQKAEDRLKSWANPLIEYNHTGKPKIDSAVTTDRVKVVNVYISANLTYFPFREENLLVFTESIRKELGRKYRKSDIKIYSNGFLLEQLVPNSLRQTIAIDTSRIIKSDPQRSILVRKTGEYTPLAGLSGKSIALWHSHGYFYEATLDRWEFQRARLFGTVEDLSTNAYVMPYLVPMLENSGAYTLIPRERDFQINEVIVDNDHSTGKSEVVIHLPGQEEIIQSGFLLRDTLFTGENPFRMGTSVRLRNDSALYIPDIPEDGEYAVYVSWPRSDDNSHSVLYSVNHTGGTTGFIVDQTIGGATWTYLGTFRFTKGVNRKNGSVTVSDIENKGAYIGLDAMKFGGGMGNVARRPWGEIIANQRSVEETATAGQVTKTDVSMYSSKTSGKSRFVEGSRYFLQYAGMPDSLVYTPTLNKNDYNDDYQSRGLWVNYLSGNPDNSASEPGGLGIPVDMAFAFHTDAGITLNDSIIGTLAIYSTASDSGLFPDGYSRMASRDLSDMIQTQIVDDIRLQFNMDWTRRGLWDRPYAEARRPNVPTMLLELLSHQNQSDMTYGLDPRFRFAVSRAIYKGILKYFAYNENREFVVQPLPVEHMAITPVEGLKIRLSWVPQTDTLEPTAVPHSFKVYMRTGENGFDNGFYTNSNYVEIQLPAYDTIYSFKVSAINDGGESFESEILSVGLSSTGNGNVLIVNGFDRVSGPEWFHNGEMAGVAWWSDRGVPRKYDISPVGDQYDFDRKSPWLDDDSPGWGASYSDMEGKVIMGNTFDFSIVHGSSILKSGYSFFSVSDEYFCSEYIPVSTFGIIDIIMGEEKTTPGFADKSKREFAIYTPGFIKKIKQVTGAGANIFISGAYIGTDLQLSYSDSTAIKFASAYLGFKPRTGHAVNAGQFYSTDIASESFNLRSSFNTSAISDYYQVEAPDAIEPAGRGAITVFRYSQNHTSAGIMFHGAFRTIVLGFPFETITDGTDRDELMKQVLNFLKSKSQ